LAPAGISLQDCEPTDIQLLAVVQICLERGNAQAAN
jgi:hypothetical protein